MCVLLYSLVSMSYGFTHSTHHHSLIPCPFKAHIHPPLRSSSCTSNLSFSVFAPHKYLAYTWRSWFYTPPMHVVVLLLPLFSFVFTTQFTSSPEQLYFPSLHEFPLLFHLHRGFVFFVSDHCNEVIRYINELLTFFFSS